MELIIRKTDESGNPLKDAAFTIYQNGLAWKSGTTGEDGTFKVEKLQDGEYQIHETGAPSGYQARKEIVTFLVENGGIQLKGSVNEDIWSIARTQDENGEVRDSFTMQVKNKELYKLPTAGGPGVYGTAAAGTLLMCAAAVLFIAYSKRTAERNTGRKA